MEEECTSVEAINPKASKCFFDKAQKICKEEKKLYNEIEDGATKDICLSANVSEPNKICVFNNETNSCNEFYIIRNDANNNIKNILLCILLYMLLFL